ncbi:hypothetical protein AGMMS50229_03150 [Campylobacterota bacterium]|nr:hypothetical protein AGMMS50229_03150 [Campylobacterota bacterium]
MDLKEMVLSALANMEAEQNSRPAPTAADEETYDRAEAATAKTPPAIEPIVSQDENAKLVVPATPAEPIAAVVEQTSETAAIAPSGAELKFLNDLRERILVLFEGFLSPNNRAIESKVDLTLNFCEYTLALIEDRIQTLGGK